jgi:selenocysteine-specific elongation factor
MTAVASRPGHDVYDAVTSPLGVAVIGHVNHGKTALVRALTGMETDRLAEERARGLSITLGFAWRDYPGGTIDFLDAPGHEDFIRAMVMGATGARAVLLVISGPEGVRRQTREHLRIAELLGLRAGVVAVSKADLLDETRQRSLGARSSPSSEGTFLAREPIVFCSAQTGAGLGRLHDALGDLIARAPEPDAGPGAILPLDRVFSVVGSGTVVTGTLQGGSLRSGAEAVLMPSGRSVTLRQLQVHGRTVAAAAAGGRVAASLRGVPMDEVQAGEVLCTPDALTPSLVVDVALTLSPESVRPLKSGEELRVLWGARQDIGRVRLMQESPLAPGGSAMAQFRFSAPVAVFAGQRAILRRPSPAETIGGAVVLDPVAPRLRGALEARCDLLDAAGAGDVEKIADLLASRDGGSISVQELARLSKLQAGEVRLQLSRFEALDDDRLASRAVLASTRLAYLTRLAEAHDDAPQRLWAPLSTVRDAFGRGTSRSLLDHVESCLAADGEIRLKGAHAALVSHDPLAALPVAALNRLHALEAQVRDGGVSPPQPAALAESKSEDAVLIELLIDTGRFVRLRNHGLRQTLVFHSEAFDEALATLRAVFPAPAAFTTGEARAALGTSRKFVVPILEFLDARSDAVRDGDVRRLAEAPAKPLLAP